MDWTERVRAAEGALREQVQAARELERSLVHRDLQAGDPGWTWFQRRTFVERWEARPWSPWIRPRPTVTALFLFATFFTSLCAAGTFVNDWPLLVVAIVGTGLVGGALMSVLFRWREGRQVLVRGPRAVALVQAQAFGQRARVSSVQDFDQHGARLPLSPPALLGDEAVQALERGSASPEVIEELALVVLLVQTRSAQLLEADRKLVGEPRERALVWWHELHDSLDRALVLLREEPQRALPVLRYLLLHIGPQLDEALKHRRLPELPPPADWEAIGEARPPAELEALRGG